MTPIHAFTRELQKHRVQGDESTNAEYEHHNGSFGEYFRNKQVKLDTQAKEQYQQSSDVFKECVIYITGHTIPSAAELKRIIVANGGQVCAFLGGKSYATHIVAANLTSRKTIEYANYKVVKPAWVVESAKSGIRLDWTRYRTITSPQSEFFGRPASDGETLDTIDDDMDIPDDAVQGPSDPAVLELPGPLGDEARVKWILSQRERTNCMDPDFISSYFAKSRLHFLSTRKLELRHRCRLYEPPLIHGTQPHVRSILHVDFDSFFVAVALKKRPDLIDKPVCVSHGSASSDIASCNYVARKFGIRNGSWVSNAKLKCPDLVCLPYDFEEYVRCSDILYQALLALQPLHITAISVDEAIVDVSNTTEDICKLCEDLRETIKERTGIHVSIGVGSNILLAKLALKKAKPAGFHIISPSEIGSFKVKDLPGVGPYIESKLKDLSVNSVADLCSVPLNVLQARIGKSHGQRLYEYARAQDTDDITRLDVPIRTIGIEIGWGVRLLDATEKKLFVDNCVQELWSRLQKAGQGCDILTVKIYRKSDSAPFLPPKFLGHGLCDISSRSKKVNSNISLNDLKATVHQLVAATPCPPLEMRGIGLHMRVIDDNDKSKEIDPKQSRITAATLANNQSPSTPSKPMIPVLPRKRRRGVTLTQSFPREQAIVDMDVFAELPTQIRKEIMINEDDYFVPEPSHVPSFDEYYQKTPFLNLRDEDIRRLLRKWVGSASSPTVEDAKAFYEYVCTASRDSNWTRILELVDWFGMHAKRSGSEDWIYLYNIVDSETQKHAAQHMKGAS